MQSTVGESLASAIARLREAGSPSPRLDAEVLLGHALGRDRSWLLAHPEASVDAAAFEPLLERRANGEPIAYIRGFKEWHSLRIRTDRRALIPRPETELLADAAADEIAARLAAGDTPTAWDIGTGSGAIPVLLGRRFATDVRDGRLRLVASDVSPDALALAAENLADHGIDGVELREADLLANAATAPDVVIANLPYVRTAEVDGAQGSLAFEPRGALDGGADGLNVVRRLIASLPAAVAPGASVYMEVGAGQAAAVEAMAPAGASVSLVNDLAGVERVVRISL